MSDLETKFTEASEFVRSGEKPKTEVPNERKLVLYGLYKQATEGDVSGARPSGFLGFSGEATYKWDSWNDNKGKICRRYFRCHADSEVLDAPGHSSL